MRERIDRLRRFTASPKGNAALTALAVFLGLYLAVAVGLAGSAINLWIGLFWPWHMRTLELAVLLTLGSFAGVSVFVYRLRLQLATGDGAPARVPEGERAGLTPRARAALAALAVFLGLYLAVGGQPPPSGPG